MANAWGTSWGSAWGASWGSGSAPNPTLVWADRCHQTSQTAGTGNLTLSGTPIAKRPFSAVLNAGDACYGWAASQTVNEFEVTLFTFQSDGTLARAATPLASSNGGALVDFSGTVLDVMLDVPAKVLAASLTTPGYTVVAR